MYVADLISAARSRNHEERTSYNAEQGESPRFGLFLKDAFESYAVPADEETGSAYELKAGAEVLSTLPPPVSGESFLKEAVAGGRIVTAEELSLKYLTQCSAFLTESRVWMKTRFRKCRNILTGNFRPHGVRSALMRRGNLRAALRCSYPIPHP